MIRVLQIKTRILTGNLTDNNFGFNSLLLRLVLSNGNSFISALLSSRHYNRDSIKQIFESQELWLRTGRHRAIIATTFMSFLSRLSSIFFCQYHLLKLVSQSPHHKSSYSVYTEIKSLINHLTPASTESHLLVFEAVFQKF